MEADILCHLVEEVGTYEPRRRENSGDTVQVPEEQRLHIDVVCCDEGRRSRSIGGWSILKQAGVQ